MSECPPKNIVPEIRPATITGDAFAFLIHGLTEQTHRSDVILSPNGLMFFDDEPGIKAFSGLHSLLRGIVSSSQRKYPSLAVIAADFPGTEHNGLQPDCHVLAFGGMGIDPQQLEASRIQLITDAITLIDQVRLLELPQ